MIIFTVPFIIIAIALFVLTLFEKIKYLHNKDSFENVMLFSIILFSVVAFLGYSLVNFVFNHCEYTPEVSKTYTICKINDNYVTSVDNNTYAINVITQSDKIETILIPKDKTEIHFHKTIPQIKYYRPKFKNPFIDIMFCGLIELDKYTIYY